MTSSLLFDFRDPAAVRGWHSIDDVVMGGVSSSRLESAAGCALFLGRVSRENQGGFASIRSAVANFQLGGWDGLELDLTGDGRRYKLNLRLDAAFDGVTYQAEFEPPRERGLVRLPFAELRASWRGQRDTDGAAFEAWRVATIGILIGDAQEGPFRLQLFGMAAFRARS